MLSFDDTVRTTRTVIADTNLSIDIAALYDAITIVPYTVPVKKKGRRRKGAQEPAQLVACGSIISAKYNGKHKGVTLGKGKTAFKNSVTIVMDVLGKKINFKLSKNGRFQITGNNTDRHIRTCVQHTWTLLTQFPEKFSIDGQFLTVTFWSSMENFKINLGFRLDRQHLNTYVNRSTEYISVFETSSGSASVNIKMPLMFDDMVLTTMELLGDVWVLGETTYNEFSRTATGKIRNRDERYVSFLVFHTGEVIMTSMERSVMEPYFREFVRIIDDCKHMIL